MYILTYEDSKPRATMDQPHGRITQHQDTTPGAHQLITSPAAIPGPWSAVRAVGLSSDSVTTPRERRGVERPLSRVKGLVEMTR